MKLKLHFTYVFLFVTSIILSQECPEGTPPTGGTGLPFLVCSGDPLNIDLSTDAILTSEEWVMDIQPNENILGQTLPINGTSNITDTLINTSDVVQIVVYGRFYTIEDCGYLFDQLLSVLVRPSNDTDLSKEIDIIDSAESGSTSDGFTTINLQELDYLFINADSYNAPTIFYATEEDAVNNTNPLPDLYQNTTPFTQTIYGIFDPFFNDTTNEHIVFNLDDTCTNIVPITINTISSGLIENPPIDLLACEEDNGFATFNLTQNNTIVLGSQNPADFSITYHLTQADAANDANPIPNPNAYTSSDATVFVRVEEIANTALFEIGVFNVIVNPIPNVPPDLGNLELCSEDGAFGVFDLTVFDTIATGGDPDLIVTYFESLADLNVGIAIVNPTTYTNVVNPQLIYIKVEDLTTSCYTTSIITLEVFPNPPIATPIPDLTQCNDGSNLAAFDLETNTVIILGDLDPTNYTVTYHESQLDATDGSFPIGDPANYVVIAPGTVIWARLESSFTGCASIASFNLSIVEPPMLSQDTPFDYTFCEQFDGNDTMGDVDLTTLADDAGFLSPPQNTTDFDISYHDSAVEAENNAFPIDQSVLFTVNDGDELFFRIENIAAGCFSISSVIFNVESRPLTTTPTDYEVCDDDNDGIFDAFVLSSRNDEITGGAPDVEVIYYLTESDAINATVGIDIDDMNYINSNDPFFQTVYARIENETTGCFAIEPLNLVVLNTPEINNTPSAYSVCDDNSDGLGVFDLTSRESEILEGLDPANYTITWFVNQAAVDANIPIAAPTVYFSNASTVIAVVIDINQSTTTFCSQQVALELNLNACVDTDNDGIPDEEEDLNGNGDLEDDDTDNDDIPNYLDDDDDGDLVMTIDEITGIGAGVAPQDFIDTDDDMIENYLDDDDDGDAVLTRDEDYNNSGSPLDDDTNDNGIPDFLDPDVALSTDEFTVTNFTIYPNPAIDHITITGTVPFEKMSIYDITGKLVLEQTEASQVTQTLTLPAIKKGMYFIRIDDQSSALRFLKK